MKYLIAPISVVLILFTLRYLVQRHIKKRISQKQRSALIIINNITFFTFLILVISTTISNMGINLEIFFGGVGVVSFILGLALKDNINSLFVGITILVGESIRVGDILLFKDLKGKVVQITIRSIILEDFNDQKKKHVIKNSAIANDYYSVIHL